MVLPTVTSNMWHPVPELRARWLREYGKDRFTFDEAREAQSFPSWWVFPNSKTKKWKWLAEAFPPRVACYLFNKYVKGEGLTLLDLFAGIGGWGLGAAWSGKFREVVMVEIDGEKVVFLNLNFAKLNIKYRVICRDARQVNYDFNIDVVTASPPCEDLTILKHFNYNETNKGTMPLTLFTIELVEKLKPKIAFYENVYRLQLKELLEKKGWKVYRFDMSKIIPQKRTRLIAIKSYR